MSPLNLFPLHATHSRLNPGLSAAANSTSLLNHTFTSQHSANSKLMVDDDAVLTSLVNGASFCVQGAAIQVLESVHDK